MFATFPAFPKSLLQGLQTLIKWNNLSRTKKTKIQERTQQNAEKSSLSQVSECPTTTVHSASSAADYQQGQQAMSIFTGAVIHGGQFNISISSLNQSPTLATPETEIKSTKRYKRLKVLVSDSG